MTVASETSKVQYNGDGATTDFSVTFKYTAKAQIVVVHTDSAGVETTWVLGTQYTLTDPGASGTLTVDVTPTDYTPASGETLTIYRDVDFTQVSDYTTGGGLTAEGIESDLDTRVFQIQRLREMMSRALLLPQSTGESDLAIPELVAGKGLAVNDDGDALEWADIKEIFVQNSAPSTSEPSGSLWIDADSADTDLYQLVSGVWTDTGVNLIGATGATGPINGTAGSTDNAIIRADGTGGATIQSSGVTIDDNDDITGAAGGMAITGGTGSGDDLALSSTSDATKGTIRLGDASTGLFFDETNERVSLGGPENTFTFAGVGPIGIDLAIHNDEAGETCQGTFRYSDTASLASCWNGMRSRGTKASPTVVQNGDQLALISAFGYDGTDYEFGGYISGIIDGAPGNNAMPMAWDFYTNPGTQTPARRVRFRADGSVEVVTGPLTVADGGVVVEVATLAALKALTAGSSPVVIMQGYTSAGDGGGGIFRWDASDLSTEVTADTQSGIYVPPDSDSDGSSGAWVRQYSGGLRPGWFGAGQTGLEAACAMGLPVDLAHDEITITTTIDQGAVNLQLYGQGAKLICGTDSLQWFFEVEDAAIVDVQGIECDGASLSKGFFKVDGVSEPSFDRMKPHSFKNDPSTAGNYSAFQFTHCPEPRLTDIRAENIGEQFDASGSQVAQYRVITLNTGCGRPVIDRVQTDAVFQVVVAAEYPDWANGDSITTGDRVNYWNGSSYDQYRALQDHTATTTTNEPPNASFWVLEREDVDPTCCHHSNGKYRNTRDNSIYAIENVRSYIGVGNEYIDQNDEPIVAACRDFNSTGEVWRNWKNKAIALELGTNPIKSVVISNPTFVCDSSDYTGDTINFRNASATNKVENLSINGGVIRCVTSLGSGSFMSIREVGNLYIGGMVIDVPAGSNEKVIRIFDTVDRGLIGSNVIKTTSDNANAIFNEGTGSKIIIMPQQTNANIRCNTTQELPLLAWFQDTGSNIYARDPRFRILWGSAVPTSGAWTRGDIIFDDTPSAAGTVGWVCTSSGSPGTWKTFGTIAA